MPTTYEQLEKNYYEARGEVTELEAKYLKLGVSYSAMHQRAEIAEDKLEKAETRVKELETLLKSHPHPYFAHHVAEALKEKTP